MTIKYKTYIRLMRVAYSGDNLGDDIRLNISLSGKIIRTTHQIQHDTIRELRNGTFITCAFAPVAGSGGTSVLSDMHKLINSRY